MKINLLLKNNLFINFTVLFFIITVFLNHIHNSTDKYKKVEENGENYIKVSSLDLKKDFSKLFSFTKVFIPWYKLSSSLESGLDINNLRYFRFREIFEEKNKYKFLHVRLTSSLSERLIFFVSATTKPCKARDFKPLVIT